MSRLRKGVPLSELFIQGPTVTGLRSTEPRFAEDTCAERPSRGNAGS
jgi:hypothetical protein